MKLIRVSNVLGLVAISLLLSTAAWAQGSAKTAAGGGMPAMADTADSHLATAKWYDDKAAEYRKEADAHRQMLASYKAMTPGPAKGGQPNPWAAKMEKHCQMFIDEFEKLATEAQQFAAFERNRAKELQQHK